MAQQYKSKFTDGNGNIFKVHEVIDTPVGLTVYYTNVATQQDYSCLLEAFGQRFTELVQ